jgi:hypothetical protein
MEHKIYNHRQVLASNIGFFAIHLIASMLQITAEDYGQTAGHTATKPIPTSKIKRWMHPKWQVPPGDAKSEVEDRERIHPYHCREPRERSKTNPKEVILQPAPHETSLQSPEWAVGIDLVEMFSRGIDIITLVP